MEHRLLSLTVFLSSYYHKIIHATYYHEIIHAPYLTIHAHIITFYVKKTYSTFGNLFRPPTKSRQATRSAYICEARLLGIPLVADWMVPCGQFHNGRLAKLQWTFLVKPPPISCDTYTLSLAWLELSGAMSCWQNVSTRCSHRSMGISRMRDTKLLNTHSTSAGETIVVTWQNINRTWGGRSGLILGLRPANDVSHWLGTNKHRISPGRSLWHTSLR